MAGHSHAKNVMHRKEAQNKKKTKVFTRAARAITIAIKEGGSSDVTLNNKLRFALRQAQLARVPKEVINKALSKDNDMQNMEEVFYEGYGPNGIAVIIQTFTNNRNKTAPEIRAVFSKYGGNLGETNSVSFLFDHIAVMECIVEEKDYEAFFLDAVSLGANDVQKNIAYFDAKDFNKSGELEKNWQLVDAKLCYIAKNFVELDDTSSIENMINALEENESTQNCWHNFKEHGA